MPSLKLSEMLLAQSGKSPSDLNRNSNLSKVFRRDGVRSGVEFARIMALPRRKWETDPRLQETVDVLTKHFKTPNGTRVLRPGQAVALQELHDYSACLCASELGSGKTDVAFLSAVVKNAKRPLFLGPANLLGKYNDKYEMIKLGKTEREFKHLAKEWKGHDGWKYLSYEKLSRTKQSDFLERYQPDLIVCEEGHRLKNWKAGVTKKVRHYKDAHPDCQIVILTGSLKRKSLLECAHLAEWCLGELSPIVRRQSKYYNELEEHRRALDLGTKEQDKMLPGVLQQFAPGGDLQAIRDAYTIYRQETPGWVTVTGSGCDSALVLEGEKIDDYPSHVDDKFQALRESYETPDGESFVEPKQLWMFLEKGSLGYWHRLRPEPPKEWKDAKRDWGRLVRDVLSSGQLVHGRHLYTELEVANACAKGHIVNHGIYDRWKTIRPTYDRDKHLTREWFDDTFLNWCVKWLEKEKSPLFTPHIGFGEKLREVTGLPYFHESARDPKFGHIDEYKGGPCIASMGSIMQGFNLQDRWNKGCLIGRFSNSAELHQLIGRFHRPGQEIDEVEFVFAYGCIETLDALHRARVEAQEGDNKQHKLVLGDWAVDSLEDAETWKGPRWQKA